MSEFVEYEPVSCSVERRSDGEAYVVGKRRQETKSTLLTKITTQSSTLASCLSFNSRVTLQDVCGVS